MRVKKKSANGSRRAVFLCVGVFFCFCFFSPVCGAGIAHVGDVKWRLAGRGETSRAVYVQAQHCLILHKAFVHSVSRLCVCVGEEGVSWPRVHVAVCACEPVTVAGMDPSFPLKRM